MHFRFKGCFLSGLDQETVVSEIVSCVISEAKSIKTRVTGMGSST